MSTGSVVVAARRAIASLSDQVRIAPVGGLSWTSARIGLGPWPGRVVLDEEAQRIRLEAAVPGVTDTSLIEPSLDGFPFGTPATSYELAPGPTTVTLSYDLELSPVDPESVFDAAVRLVSATVALAHGAWDALSSAERSRLADLGIASRQDLSDLPSVRLLAEPVPWAGWDGASAAPAHPTPTSAQRMAQRLHLRTDQRDPERLTFNQSGFSGSIESTGPTSVRIRIVLASDVDPDSALEWVRHHWLVGRGGRVALTRTPPHALVFDARGEVDHFGDPWAAAYGLRNAWPLRSTGREDLVSRLAAEGMLAPPLGPVMATDVDVFGYWHWGNRWLSARDLYLFDIDLVASHLRSEGALFAVSYSGQGINSYGLNMVTTTGPVAAFVQHSWGGVYGNTEADRARVNATVRRLHMLMDHLGEQADPAPRWLVALSSFRGICGIIDMHGRRTSARILDNLSVHPDEDALFAAARTLVP